jgi:hypothetical protein
MEDAPSRDAGLKKRRLTAPPSHSISRFTNEAGLLVCDSGSGIDCEGPILYSSELLALLWGTAIDPTDRGVPF